MAPETNDVTRSAPAPAPAAAGVPLLALVLSGALGEPAGDGG
jgi:hypothetical protein